MCGSGVALHAAVAASSWLGCWRRANRPTIKHTVRMARQPPLSTTIGNRATHRWRGLHGFKYGATAARKLLYLYVLLICQSL